jgi:hypothetical protein
VISINTYKVTFLDLKRICKHGAESIEGFTCRTKSNKSFTNNVSWGKCDEENCPLIQEQRNIKP